MEEICETTGLTEASILPRNASFFDDLLGQSMNASRGVAAIGVASTMPWLELDRWLNRFLIRCKQRLTGQPLVVARHVMPAKPLNLIALDVSVLILKSAAPEL